MVVFSKKLSEKCRVKVAVGCDEIEGGARGDWVGKWRGRPRVSPESTRLFQQNPKRRKSSELDHVIRETGV